MGLTTFRVYEVPVVTFAASIHKSSALELHNQFPHFRWHQISLVIGIPHVPFGNVQDLNHADFVTCRATPPFAVP